jgi:DNA-binding NtrC family response regulator
MTTSNIFTIFVLDDEPWYGTMLQHYLSQNTDFRIERFEHTNEMLSQLYRKPDAITVDFSMPDINGQESMLLIRQQLPDVPVIIISGQEDIETAISLLKDGAFDYILKDSNTTKRLSNTLQHIREIRLLKTQLEGLKNEVVKKYDFSNTMLGKSGPMVKVIELVQKAAMSNIIVSITGDQGTGKELVAKTIHYNSARLKGPFVTVNVGSIPKGHAETELFGCEKGVANNAHTIIGKLEEANNGTLFLKDVSELNLSMQTKLLRFLEEKTITRVGGADAIPLNVRIITGNKENLKVAVTNREFREDLYYKLLGLPINIPALKDRGDDLLLLAKIFVDEFCKQNRLPSKQLSPKAKGLLLRYKFPGNVRELKSLMELAVVLSADDIIEASDINLQNPSVLHAVIEKEKTLKEYEHEIVQHYLEKYEGNVLQVAEKLAIGKSTLYRMLKSNVLQ